MKKLQKSANYEFKKSTEYYISLQYSCPNKRCSLKIDTTSYLEEILLVRQHIAWSYLGMILESLKSLTARATANDFLIRHDISV